MVRKRFAFVAASVALLILLWATGGVVAGPPAEGPGGEVNIAGTVASKISYQGRLTDPAGNPLDGTYTMRFRLYDAQSGGTMLWDSGAQSVQVTNGLFNVKLDVDPGDFNGQELWLEVRVGGEMLAPRQEILPVPYALSLRPGAVISDTTSYVELNRFRAKPGVGSWKYGVYAKSEGTGLFAFYYGVYGSGSTTGVYGSSDSGTGVYGYSDSGHAVHAQSSGGAFAGAALWAQNTNTTNGIAVWADNESSDTTLVVRNKGAGPLIKGFGGDGGEDEFRVSNNGKIETKADSYIFISGNEFIKNKDTDTTRWDCRMNGSVRIWRGSAAGTKWIYIPITLPGVLYGQEVKLKSITVYYKCEDGSINYITGTYLYKQTDADSQVTLVADTTDRKSNTATSYTLDVNHALSSDTGILGLYLGLHFEDDTHYIQIGGVRLRLGHHHLY